MMGDRDFRAIIQNALGSIGRELQLDIDSKDIQTIHIQEVVQCLRRSYFDRIDPMEIERRGFNELLSGLLRKLEYGSEPKVFEIDQNLVAQTEWFDDEIIGTKHGDFFVKRSINYSKRTQSITSDDLF